MNGMKRIGSRAASLLLIIAMIICTCSFSPKVTVNAQTSTTSKSSVQAVNSVYRYMIKYGNNFYIRSEDGILSYNVKTKKTKMIVKSLNYKYGPMLLYNGYIYFNKTVKSVDYIYRVDVNRKKAPQLLCKNGTLGFVYKNRIYYGNKGLCSMALDGRNKKRHTTDKKASSDFVFYYKNRFFYGDSMEQYSVDTSFRNKKKSANAYAYIIKVLNYTMSASSVEIKNGQCWVEADKKTGNWNTLVYSIKSGSKNIKKTFYKSKKQKLSIEASCDSGYLLIAEANSKVSWQDMYRKGSLKIVNVKGKVIATIR